MVTYSTHDVPVRGGALRVGRWQGDGPVEHVVLAVHGITANHTSWQLIGDAAAPGTVILAPDLRGRGRSGSLPGRSGMTQHATDCVAVLRELADGRCDVAVGHSMGGFVVATLAGEHPDAVGRVLLVDGGVPFVVPEGVDMAEMMKAGLGPAVGRLSADFASREDYQAFWRQHPAFADEWNDAVAAYVDYDLGDGPPYRSTVSGELVGQDYPQMFVGGEADRAWRTLGADALLLRASRGLMNEATGLYRAAMLDAWAAGHPNFSWRGVPDVNHYTITLGSGAGVVTDAIAELLASR